MEDRTGSGEGWWKAEGHSGYPFIHCEGARAKWTLQQRLYKIQSFIQSITQVHESFSYKTGIIRISVSSA